MNTELIGQSWDKLAGKHQEMVATFYDRFFDKFPHYRKFFPESMEHQLKRMVETIALLARVTDETEVTHPHLVKVGSRHTGYSLTREDLDNFKTVFVQVVGEYCADDWNQEYQESWTEAFEQHIIPYMMHGLKMSQAH